MKNLLSNALKIGTGIVIGTSMTAFASMTLLQNVYLNDEISISVNGQVKEMRDATTNEREYPLTYKGRTYIPLRSVATLLGYNVGYVTETNTATVDSKDYVAPSTSGKPTLSTLSTSDIPLLKKYKWYDTLQNKYDSLITANCTNTVNSLYMRDSVTRGKKTVDDFIHSESPFKEEMKKQLEELYTYDLFGTDKSVYEQLQVKAICDNNSVKYLKYAYDSNGKLKGFVASYTIDFEYTYGNNRETKKVDATSVFIWQGGEDLNNYGNYAWVCDLVN